MIEHFKTLYLELLAADPARLDATLRDLPKPVEALAKKGQSGSFRRLSARMLESFDRPAGNISGVSHPEIDQNKSETLLQWSAHFPDMDSRISSFLLESPYIYANGADLVVRESPHGVVLMTIRGFGCSRLSNLIRKDPLCAEAAAEHWNRFFSFGSNAADAKLSQKIANAFGHLVAPSALDEPTQNWPSTSA